MTRPPSPLRRLSVMSAAVSLSAVLHSAPATAAESHIVVDAATGIVLDAKRERFPRAVASLTKVAAVAVALEWLEETGGEVDQIMEVGEAALSGGANPLNLRAGDSISLDSALHAAMLSSDNTSISVLAEHIGGRGDPVLSGAEAVARFVERMNRLAARLGMEDTRFVNPHGLDEPSGEGVSTAADMALLAMHAYRLPLFPGYCSSLEREVAFRRESVEIAVRLINTNELTGSRGIDGVKTGTTWRAGECLMASAVRAFPSIDGDAGGHRLVSVVLKSENRFRDTVLLLDRGWERFEEWMRAGMPDGGKERLIMGSD